MMFYAIKLKHEDDVLHKNITIDLNTMRVAVVCIMENECLRTKKGSQNCAMDYEISLSHGPSEKDYKNAREVEGVLELAHHLATVAQYENYHVVEHGPIFKLIL